MTLKAYKFHIYPNKEQRIFLAKSFGSARFMWNQLLANKRETYAKNKQLKTNVGFYRTEIVNGFPVRVRHTVKERSYTSFKSDYEFLKEIDNLALANVGRNLTKAFNDFFKGESGYPKFKSKNKTKKSYKTYNQKGTIKITSSGLKVPKLKSMIKVNQHRDFHYSPQRIIKSCTISQNASGDYYASILVDHLDEEGNDFVFDTLHKTGSMIGLDLGLSNFLIDSDGNKYDNPQLDTILQLQARIDKENKILSRRREVAKKNHRKLADAKNYQKQKLKIAKLHQRIANIRKDFQHKLSLDIVKNHDVICLEDLDIQAMMKDSDYARSIASASWYSFTQFLQYKAEWYGKEVIKIGQYFASTQNCSTCHEKTGPTSTKVREWTCPNCHEHHDRDVNAAMNILDEGLRLRSA